MRPNIFPVPSATRAGNHGFSLAALAGLILLVGCGRPAISADAQPTPDQAANQEQQSGSSSDLNQKGPSTKMETATLGAGCFWCVEAVFLQLKGVKSVESGYMGGVVENPTYKQVCTGRTGHAEVVQIKFDPEVISFDELLEVFWKTHDPTTLNRQGNDFGTQYRSVIFHHSDQQRETAKKYKQKLNEVRAFRSPVVTEISEASTFYIAEDYHQDYFNKNPNDRYCQMFIPSKLQKLKKVFADKLKDK